MFITKRRHEAESLRDEISRLRGARMMDAETIRQQDERHKLAAKDLEALVREIASLERRVGNQRSSIASLMIDAEKWRARAARERARGEARRNARSTG